MSTPALFVAALAAASGVVHAEPSTEDLSFLLGEWTVERVHQPGSENERRSEGSLACARAIEEASIRCEYYFERTNAGPIRDVAYFNYNGVYDAYESIWLSATWPVKNTMAAPAFGAPTTLIWESTFLIEGGVREWVRTAWSGDGDASFSRRVDIRTSRDPKGAWRHWMTETATRIAGE
ncbi:MAG: hypothetical protein GC152_05545 [Alphaproteobacteria bacterium]|nr:hypothetical protein [Alphaproteobacteria bacterium]